MEWKKITGSGGNSQLGFNSETNLGALLANLFVVSMLKCWCASLESGVRVPALVNVMCNRSNIRLLTSNRDHLTYLVRCTNLYKVALLSCILYRSFSSCNAWHQGDVKICTKFKTKLVTPKNCTLSIEETWILVTIWLRCQLRLHG